MKSQNMNGIKNDVYCRVIVFKQISGMLFDADYFDCFFNKKNSVRYNAVFIFKIKKDRTIIFAQKIDCSDLSVQKVFCEQNTPKKIYEKLKNENMPLFLTKTMTLCDAKVIKQLLNLD